MSKLVQVTFPVRLFKYTIHFAKSCVVAADCTTARYGLRYDALGTCQWASVLVFHPLLCALGPKTLNGSNDSVTPNEVYLWVALTTSSFRRSFIAHNPLILSHWVTSLIFGGERGGGGETGKSILKVPPLIISKNGGNLSVRFWITLSLTGQNNNEENYGENYSRGSNLHTLLNGEVRPNSLMTWLSN